MIFAYEIGKEAACQGRHQPDSYLTCVAVMRRLHVLHSLMQMRCAECCVLQKPRSCSGQFCSGPTASKKGYAKTPFKQLDSAAYSRLGHGDGIRRITHVTEIAGMEGDIIITQDLFSFRYDDSTYGDEVRGSFDCSGLRPVFSARASYYGLEKALIEAMQS